MIDNIIYFDNFKNKRVVIYADKEKKEPFSDWFKNLAIEYREKILIYIKRVAAGGSKKNVDTVGGGIFEIKIDYGPGIRIYFGQEKNKMVILIGGFKKSQNSNIVEAKRMWEEYEKTKKLR